jgi:putative membrane protein
MPLLSRLLLREAAMFVAPATQGQWGERGATYGSTCSRGFARPASRWVARRRCYPDTMVKLVVRWLLLAAALLLVAYLYPGVTVSTFGAAMIAALVLGLLNTIVRPLLVLLTLPVTLITLGLFLFVINALMFWAAAGVLDGFNVTGFAAALIGSLIYSLCGMVIDVAVERLFSRDAKA